MNFRNVLLAFGLFLALVIPSTAFSGDSILGSSLNNPLLMAKNEVNCDNCTKKLTSLCDGEFKVCASKDGAAACQAFYDKCKASVVGRCGGPNSCGD